MILFITQKGLLDTSVCQGACSTLCSPRSVGRIFTAAVGGGRYGLPVENVVVVRSHTWIASRRGCITRCSNRPWRALLCTAHVTFDRNCSKFRVNSEATHNFKCHSNVVTRLDRVSSERCSVTYIIDIDM
jgi:hypothetical protein